MKSASSPPPNEVENGLALLKAEASGQLDDLTCPKCGEATVSVWFTHPAAREYQTWFVCGACDFEMRAQNTGLPTHYSKDRDRTGQAAARE